MMRTLAALSLVAGVAADAADVMCNNMGTTACAAETDACTTKCIAYKDADDVMYPMGCAADASGLTGANAETDICFTDSTPMAEGLTAYLASATAKTGDAGSEACPDGTTEGKVYTVADVQGTLAAIACPSSAARFAGVFAAVSLAAASLLL